MVKETVSLRLYFVNCLRFNNKCNKQTKSTYSPHPPIFFRVSKDIKYLQEYTFN